MSRVVVENADRGQNVGNNRRQLVRDDVHAAGGGVAPSWKPTNWLEHSSTVRHKSRVEIELLHKILGHRSVNSLMAA